MKLHLVSRSGIASLCTALACVLSAGEVAAVVPGCEGYPVDTGEIYIEDHPDRAVVGRAFLFQSQSDALLDWGHGTLWKLAYFTPPSTTTVTQTRTSSIDEQGESDIHLTPTHRGTNFVSVTDTNDDYCNNASFLAINAPTVSVNNSNTSTSGGYAYGNFFMSGTMDQQYAINATAGLPMKFEIQRKSIGQWTGSYCDIVEESSSWQSAQSLSYQTDYNYVERCDAHYRFRSYDGEFFSSWTSRVITGGSTGSSSGGSSSGGGSGGSSGGTCIGLTCDDEP